MLVRPFCRWLACAMLVLPGRMAVGQVPPVAELPGPLPGESLEVIVAQPITREIREFSDFTGRTEAAQTVEIRPRVGGPIVKVAFREGAMVQQGDLLFEIDPRTYQAELEKAGAGVALAEARVKRSAAALARAKALKDRNSIGQDEFDRAMSDQDEAEATLTIARVNRDLARLNLDATHVNAPIGGRTGRALLSAGSLVKAGDTLLTTITSVDLLSVTFDVDQNTLLHLRKQLRTGNKPESELEVSMGLPSEDGFPHRLKIDFVDSQVDPQTGTIRMRALVPNADRTLLPGLFVMVRMMTGPPRQALVVVTSAESAEDENGANPLVFVVNDKNIIEKRPVKPGWNHDGLFEVKSGLTAKDWVVINLPALKFALSPGLVVKPKREPMPKEPWKSKD